MSPPSADRPVTVTALRAMKADGRRIACLTAYDASFAALLDAAGVDVVLVGDSLGMVVQGHETTLPVTLDEMIYHARAVARGLHRALLMVDLPFLSYPTPEAALHSAGRLVKEGGAHMVKLEGGAAQAATVARLAEAGIPACAHLGLQPQSVRKLGGYRVQGRGTGQAARMVEEARALEKAGADVLLLECVPADLARQVTRALSIPVIGIGAGAGCDGQILVLYDLLGVTREPVPRFVRRFLPDPGGIPGALARYVEAVRSGEFPAAEHSFD